MEPFLSWCDMFICSCFVFDWLERKKEDLSDSEDIVGERLQQDVVSVLFSLLPFQHSRSQAVDLS